MKDFYYRWFTQWQINQEMAQASKKNPYLMTYKEELQPVELPPNIPLLDTKLVESYEQGYALSKGRKKTTFSKEVIEFVKEKFFIGQRSNQKFRPDKIEEMMQSEKKDGKLRVPSKDWISVSQITSICSRITAKLKKGENVEEDELEVAEEELVADLQNHIEEEDKKDVFNHLEQNLGDNIRHHPFHVSFV